MSNHLISATSIQHHLSPSCECKSHGGFFLCVRKCYIPNLAATYHSIQNSHPFTHLPNPHPLGVIYHTLGEEGRQSAMADMLQGVYQHGAIEIVVGFYRRNRDVNLGVPISETDTCGRQWRSGWAATLINCNLVSIRLFPTVKFMGIHLQWDNLLEIITAGMLRFMVPKD
jgi:hypothetical protein